MTGPAATAVEEALARLRAELDSARESLAGLTDPRTGLALAPADEEHHDRTHGEPAAQPVGEPR